MESNITAIEKEFLKRRCRAPRLAEAFGQAMAYVGFPVQAGLLDPGISDRARALYDTGLRIAAAASGPGSSCEPAYHNRHHTSEAMLAMGMLCRVAQELGVLSGHEAAIGVVAMAGHDLHHDGSTLGGGEMEARSWDAVQALSAEMHPEDRRMMGAIIRATDPARVGANATIPVEPGRPVQDVLYRLANDADVFASLLPTLGVRLGLLLAEERQSTGDPALLRVGTARGRYDFLRGYPALSAPAILLGLEAARQGGIRAYATVARLLGAGTGAEEGCDALDRLPRIEAEAAYRAALAMG